MDEEQAPVTCMQIPALHAGSSMQQQADLIRSVDNLVHPYIVKGLSLAPGSISKPATMLDSWIYGLIQTPGILEQVMELWPLVPSGSPTVEPGT